MKLLVTGTTGQVAKALWKKHDPEQNEWITCIGRPEFDLSRPGSYLDLLVRYSPDVVVNAAAWTAVDEAEENKVAAFELNANGPGQISAAAKEFGIPIIQLSTDYVFSGEQKRPYRETDEARPLSVYGMSKFEGEKQVAAANEKHVILRTSWIYSETGKNFLKTMLALAKTRNEVTVVNDQLGSPTHADSIAEAIVKVSRRLLSATNDELYGLFHFSSRGTVSWYDFAKEIFYQSAQLNGPIASVEPISSEQFKTKAKRPANSQLDCQKLCQAYGVEAPDWRLAIPNTIAKLI